MGHDQLIQGGEHSLVLMSLCLVPSLEMIDAYLRSDSTRFFSLLEIRGASFALGGGPMGHHHILIRVLPSCGQSKSSAGRIKLFIDHACRAAFQDTFDVC